MKLVSWNVNGFRSLLGRNFLDALSALDADVYCLQETKLQAGQGGVDLPGYQAYWSYAERKGYAGTAVLTMRRPERVSYGVGDEELDREGRAITLDLGDFYLLNCYAPNAAADLSRLEARARWDACLLDRAMALDAEKPLILCGDLNVAYNAADLRGEAQGMQAPGFTRQEREGVTRLLAHDLVDAFRALHPGEAAGAFAYRRGLRAMGVDYFLVSRRLMDRVVDVQAYPRIRGSDHWPLALTLR